MQETGRKTEKIQGDVWRHGVHLKSSCGARSKSELQASLLQDTDPSLSLLTRAPRTDAGQASEMFLGLKLDFELISALFIL